MICKPKPRRYTLPITTGRVGLSQTTGEIQFYNGNPTGAHHLVWRSRPKKWATDCMCGGRGCGCCSPLRGLAAVLTGRCP